MTAIIQCAPNFSEGRDPGIIRSIVAAAMVPEVRVADWSADPDHNRLVVTVIGPPVAVRVSAINMVATAVSAIDLRDHHGVHPRLGACDVLPFVPVTDVDLDFCAELARDVAWTVSAAHDLPVFLYEDASPDGNTLPTIRKRAFREIAPDIGPSAPHPTAGACVIGARPPLIAYNIHLASADVAIAKTIARELRDGAEAGFLGVRALGLALASRGCAQVSMNITRTREVSLNSVVAYVDRRATELGTGIARGEVIGVLPGHAAFEIIASATRDPDLRPGQVLLESWPTG